jgi:DNA polymerase-3 subunit delta'
MQVKNYLETMVNRGRIGNALLFSGPTGVENSLVAEEFAKTIANPLDICHFRPEGKLALHSVDSLRAFSEQVYLAPFVGDIKVFILHDADRMQPVSANALLKTLEEPAEDTVIILTSSQPDKILATIRSRCLHFPVLALAVNESIPRGEEKGEDPLVTKVRDALICGALHHYTALVELSAVLAEMIQERMGEYEGNVLTKEMSALQKESLAKEDEAYRSKIQEQAFEVVLETIASFQIKKLRLHPQPELYEKLNKILSDAKTALDRSTTLPLIFENLFLQYTHAFL